MCTGVYLSTQLQALLNDSHSAAKAEDWELASVHSTGVQARAAPAYLGRVYMLCVSHGNRRFTCASNTAHQRQRVTYNKHDVLSPVLVLHTTFGDTKLSMRSKEAHVALVLFSSRQSSSQSSRTEQVKHLGHGVQLSCARMHAGARPRFDDVSSSNRGLEGLLTDGSCRAQQGLEACKLQSSVLVAIENATWRGARATFNQQPSNSPSHAPIHAIARGLTPALLWLCAVLRA